MKVIDYLLADHQKIVKVLAIAKTIAEQLEHCPDQASLQNLEKVVDFMQGFTGSFHHSREEELFFAAMEQTNPALDHLQVKAMLEEHMTGRQLIAAMSRIFETIRLNHIEKTEELLKLFHQYTSLLQVHIEKEENIYYPLADNLLSREQQQKIIIKFKTIEQIHQHKLDTYMNLIDELDQVKPQCQPLTADQLPLGNRLAN